MPDITIRKPRIIDPGYRVPATQPEDTICARVYIPNDNLYIAAFWGHLFMLTQWLAWERGGTKARDAAEVWKSAWELSRDWWDNNIGACGDDMDVRQSPTVPCILEKDTGEGWEQFANLALCAPRLRILGGVIQQETEDGTWETVSPATEPVEDRMNGVVVPAWTVPPEGETGNCLAAANASAYVNVVAYEIANAMGTATDFAGMLAIILGYLGGAVTGVIGMISLFLLGIAAWQSAQWNDIRDYDTTDELKEILNCLFDDTGVLSSDNWNVAKARIESARGECATDECGRRWSLVKYLVDILGPVGLSRLAASSGIMTAECDTCAETWTHTFDFVDSQSGWELIDPNLMGYPSASYVSGQGWKGVYAGSLGSTGAYRVWIKSPQISDSTIVRVYAFYSFDPDDNGDYAYTVAELWRDGSNAYTAWTETSYTGMDDQNPKSSAELSVTSDQIRIQLGEVNRGHTEPPQGTVNDLKITKVIIEGTGTDPF